MNAYELADEIDSIAKDWLGQNKSGQLANMLRQQADRIAELESLYWQQVYKNISPQTKPLSEHAIESIAFDYANEDGELDLVGFARAIEERHGIK